MYTLYLDTHDKNVLVILFKDNKILKKENIESPNKHSEIVMPTIAKILEDSKLDVKDLNNIIVVNGPGSFTGERIAVTIAKTIAYTLNIPIRVIDSLKVKAINIEDDNKIISIPDRNGAFIGIFDKNNNQLEEYVYLNKSTYNDYLKSNKVYTDVDIDYEKVYEYVMKTKELNPHSIKPLYVKGISALNDK